MKFRTLVLFTLPLFIYCQAPSIPSSSINGVWQSIGSGWILQIQDSSRYAFYDITANSCLPARQAQLNEILAALSLQTDTLLFKKGVMTYQFTKSDKIPERCQSQLTEEQQKDLLHNFEVFAETVEEHYVFMELNQIDWPRLYEQQKNKLIASPSETMLYRVLEETLELLNDNHAYLEATEEVYEALEQLPEEKPATNTDEDLPEYGDFQVANQVARHHIVEDMTKDSKIISWGKMENNIGYIQVKAMWLYADLNIPKPLIDRVGYVDAYVKTFHQMDEGSYIDKEVKGVQKVMDQVMVDLAETQSIIVDIRFNGGGQDAVNFEILKRFNPRKRQIVVTRLKHKNTFSPLLPLYLEADPHPYTRPVFVLTSPQTGSAAEAFAIGSMSIPHLKRIGSATQGALSTALEKRLPNGWTFSISNEVYMDNQGKAYENIGVPVDHELSYPKDRQTFFRKVMDDLETDQQSILQAIAALKVQ